MFQGVRAKCCLWNYYSNYTKISVSRVCNFFLFQGGNAEFFLENDGQVFEVFPTEVQGEANVLLRIVDSSALDFETTKSLTVQVEIT